MRDEFEGVWLPRYLCLYKDLSWPEKVLVNEVYNLSLINPDRGCFAGNAHFGELLNLSTGRAANMISDLTTGKVKGRKVSVSRQFIDVIFHDRKNRGMQIRGDKLHVFVKHIPNKKLNESVDNASQKRGNGGYDVPRKREQKNTSLGFKNSERDKSPQFSNKSGISEGSRATLKRLNARPAISTEEPPCDVCGKDHCFLNHREERGL